MMKLAIILFMTLALVSKKDISLEQRAKNIAEEYYSSFQKLAQMANPFDDEGTQLEVNLRFLAGSDANGTQAYTEIRTSNDIDPILGLNNSSKTDVPYSKYINKYRVFAAEKDFGFSYKVISSEQLEQPSYKGVDNDLQYVCVKVRKIYTYLNKSTDVDETMTITFPKNGVYMLSSIMNQFGTSQTAGDLLALALQYYTNRQYKDALDTFEKQIELFGDPKAYYYAAIMYYQNQGCRGMGYSKRFQKFVQGMKVAADHGNERAKFALGREGIDY